MISKIPGPMVAESGCSAAEAKSGQQQSTGTQLKYPGESGSHSCQKSGEHSSSGRKIDQEVTSHMGRELNFP
jgi:hypothetical protein